MEMKITLNGLYQYDQELFSLLELPEELDKDVFIGVLLEKAGEFPLIYPSYDYMKYAIGLFSKKWNWTIDKWAKAINIKYDPLYNFDRNEESEDVTNTSAETSSGGQSTNSISAFNDTATNPNYQPTNKAESNTSGESSGESHNIHKARLYGNIGVTTSQQMLQSEIDIGYFDIYNSIADLFMSEYCIRIY